MLTRRVEVPKKIRFFGQSSFRPGRIWLQSSFAGT